MDINILNAQQLKYLDDDIAEVSKLDQDAVVCENCFREDPCTDDGYTCCCNELSFTVRDLIRRLRELRVQWL